MRREDFNNMNPEIIICDCDHKDVETERAVFDAAGFDFKWLHCQTQDEVIEQCRGAVCFLNQYAKMDEKIFKNKSRKVWSVKKKPYLCTRF